MNLQISVFGMVKKKIKNKKIPSKVNLKNANANIVLNKIKLALY